MSNRTKLLVSNAYRSGCLYIVATPIGNLLDMSHRAIEVLKSVDLIAAEDTRHSAILLDKFSIISKMVSLHEHNELDRAPFLLEQLKQGRSVALISDAGTPLISDPGYVLVKEAHMCGIQVVPVPGASALIAALSASGLPTDAFVFAGFLPPKQAARIKALKGYRNEQKTLIFYESNHRIAQTLEDMISIFGESRIITLAREITKKYETIVKTTLGDAAHLLAENNHFLKGEFVIVLAGSEKGQSFDDRFLQEMLEIALSELSASAAASLLAKLTGQNKRELYQLALKIKNH